MTELDQKINHHLKTIGDLCLAKKSRLELALPCLDLDMRLRWHKWHLRIAEKREVAAQ